MPTEPPPGSIAVSSIVSSRDCRPYVQLRWFGDGAQMTPEEAIAHAHSLIEAAEAAKSDAILVRFLKEKVGLEPAQFTAVLQDFRTYREAAQKEQSNG